MPSVPRILVDRLGDWTTVCVDVPALLEAALDGALPDLRPDFAGIDLYGISSAWTRAHAERALDELSARLDKRGDTFQGIEHGPAGGRRFAGHRLGAGSPVVIEAPLRCRVEAGQLALSLADFPHPLALPGDLSLRIEPLPSADAVLRAWLSPDEDWKPLCRVEGLLQGVGRGATLRALRIRTRQVPPVDPGIEASLHREALHAQAQADVQREHFREPELKLTRHLLEALRNERAEADEAELRREAAGRIRLSSVDAEQIAEFEHAPFDGAVAFWLGLAALLPDGGGAARLSARGRAELLECFDASFGDAWREAASFLRHAAPLRLDGERLEALRERVARALGLAPAPAPAEPPDDGRSACPPPRGFNL